MNETLTPAYGRDYFTIGEVENAFHANKDFMMQPSGRMCNKADIERYSPDCKEVKIRYNKLRKVRIVKW